MQNGREMKIKIEAFINAIAAAVQDMATQQMIANMAEDNDITNIQNQINAMPASTLQIPQPAIANPGSIATVSVLGISVVAGAGVNGLFNTVQSILSALRNAKIINP